jgi:hypothetical protein
MSSHFSSKREALGDSIYITVKPTKYLRLVTADYESKQGHQSIDTAGKTLSEGAFVVRVILIVVTIDGEGRKQDIRFFVAGPGYSPMVDVQIMRICTESESVAYGSVF